MLELTKEEILVAQKVLEAAASWFNENDPEGEQFFPSFKLYEMAQKKLGVLIEKPPVVA